MNDEEPGSGFTIEMRPWLMWTLCMVIVVCAMRGLADFINDVRRAL